MTGKVKFFDSNRGFGFITQDQEGAPDVFFHRDAVEASAGVLATDDAVEFTATQQKRGWKATSVKLA